jgi:hypothetical protein
MLHRFSLPFVLRPLVAVVALALVGPLALPPAARADGGGDAPAGLATGGAGVARLSVIDGSVGIQRGGATTPAAAVVNAPVLADDYVTTGPQSRAEIQFDATTAVRLGENVQMRLTHIDQTDRQVQLAAGTIDLRLLRGTDGTSTIDTPSISIVPRSGGSYRVAVGDDGTTFVSVRSGRADIETPQGAQSLAPGSTLIAQGTASDPHISSRDEIASDSFDSFNDDLDRAQLAALGTSPEADTNISGMSDLGAYGNWVDDGSYGNVWIPAGVAPDWAPYRAGSWVTAGPYGYAWVAAEPWGWAPYHYGRWYYSTAYGHWAWYPPARGRVAPAWSPALVGFVGVSLGAVGVGVGFGHAAGWVPLAPYEAVRPWWGPHAVAFGASVAYGDGAGYRNARYNGITNAGSASFRAGRFSTAAPSFASAPAYARSYAQPSYAQPSYARSSYAQPSYAQPYARAAYQTQGYQSAGYQRGTYQSTYAGYARSTYAAARPWYAARGSYASQAAPARYAQRGEAQQARSSSREGYDRR